MVLERLDRCPLELTRTALREPTVARRVLDAPIVLHAFALVLVLVAAALVLGTGASFSGDEGGAIIQAQHVADGEDWLLPYEIRSVDPDGVRLSIQLSEIGPEGSAPYAQHPLWSCSQPPIVSGRCRRWSVCRSPAPSVKPWQPRP